MPEWDAVAEKRLFKVGIRALKHMEPNEELLLKYSENYCTSRSCITPSMPGTGREILMISRRQKHKLPLQKLYRQSPKNQASSTDR